MRSFGALLRASWRMALSYRLRLLLSILGLAATVAPLYFVANALQPVMEESIAGQGGEYFAFLIVGMVAFLLIPTAVNTMASETGAGINTGTLEALLSTQASARSVFLGLTGFGLTWTAVRAGTLLVAGWLLGAQVLWSQLGVALLIFLLIILAYLPFGLIATASVIVFRTPTPLGQGVLLVSALLGGVYYPTQVIPSWLELVSAFVPLTYGLRALRGSLLEGRSLGAILPELGILLAFTAVLMAVGVVLLSQALRHARRVGTLSQY